MMKFKKQISLMILIAIIFSSISFTENSFSVSIDGQQVNYDSNTGYPYMDENGQILLPLAATLETAHIDVLWDENSKCVRCSKGDIDVAFYIYQSAIIKNRERILSNSEVALKSGKTYLPLSLLFEVFEYSSEWDEATDTIKIHNNNTIVDAAQATSGTKIETILALRKLIKEKNLKVHAYSAIDSDDNQTEKEEILIKDLDEPAIILLHSEKSTEWTIVAEDPTDIVAVCLEGEHSQTLTNKDIPYYAHFPSTQLPYCLYLNHEVCSKIKFAEDVNTHYGGELETLQVSGNEIDGIASVTIVPKQIDSTEDVILFNLDDFSETNPKNVALHLDDLAYSDFLSNQGYLYGKYYFETKIIFGNSLGLDVSTNFGISTGFNSSLFFSDSGKRGNHAYCAINNSFHNDYDDPEKMNSINALGLKSGDIIGVAMDLDNDRLYFSVNGEWQNCGPTDKSTGMKIKDNRIYYVSASISSIKYTDGPQYDQIKFNFGKKAFKYPIPEGYLPYDH